MIQINNTIVSSDVVSKKFVCDLTACQGECCVAGASGAPLEDEELGVLEDIYEKVEPYLTKEGKKAVKKYGKFVIDSDGDYVTPLVGGDKECAYTIFEDGMAKCGIEKAWADGVVKFRKPISCHLYPIRIDKLKSQLVPPAGRDRASAARFRPWHALVGLALVLLILVALGAWWWAGKEDRY